MSREQKETGRGTSASGSESSRPSGRQKNEGGKENEERDRRHHPGKTRKGK